MLLELTQKEEKQEKVFEISKKVFLGLPQLCRMHPNAFRHIIIIQSHLVLKYKNVNTGLSPNTFLSLFIIIGLN